jgi:hypothetical protein
LIWPEDQRANFGGRFPSFDTQSPEYPALRTRAVEEDFLLFERDT